MTKILMVCLGNICRSPVAEGVMREIALKEGIAIEVDSAGTANYHVGEHPDKRSVANARKNGVDISKLKARQFSVSDFDTFDHIYVMDESNLRNVLAIAKKNEHKSKVNMLLNELFPEQNKPVPDPYYGTEKDFEEVFQLVYKACTKVAENLKTKINQ